MPEATMFQRILVAVGDVSSADQLVAGAAGLASNRAAQVLLVHVSDTNACCGQWTIPLSTSTSTLCCGCWSRASALAAFRRAANCARPLAGGLPSICWTRQRSGGPIC